MKVLFVCRHIPFYGISPIMTRQADGLIAKGIEVDYFTIKGKGFSAYLKAIPALKNHLLQNSTYNIIHAHYGLCGLAVTYVAKKEKTVISFMGSELIGDPFPANFFQNQLLKMINNRCIRKFDGIIVKSMRMSLALKEKTHFVIPNGVSLLDFFPLDKTEARKKVNYLSRKKLIIFISDPPDRPEKNFALLDEAVKLLNDPGIEVKCLWSLTKEDLNFYYSAADLLVLTSLHEGSPNVIKEAMACDCPIVSTDVGDVRKNIEGIDGCHIVSFEPTDVAEKIGSTINYGKTNGRKRLIELGLDSISTSNRLIEVYKKVLK